jgi:arylsulfatase A-like enzyme
MRIHFVDKLSSAIIDAPSEAHVCVQSITIERDTRTCMFQHPNSKVTFAPMAVPSRATLRFGCVLKDLTWDRVTSEIYFRIRAVDATGKSTILWERPIDMRMKEQRRWQDFEIDLKGLAGKPITFIFETFIPPEADGSYCWSAWSEPLIEAPDPSKPPRPVARRTRARHNLVLITADALRADHLGCYGHPIMKTPHIDSLAKEGVLFTEARTQTSTTPGSYASLLTGLHATQHGMLTEWDRMRADLPTLPVVLEKHGFHTLVAASEHELAAERGGYHQIFRESIRCVGVPAQPGDVTARRLTAWLDQRPDAPFFAWVQFFDTHPPSNPPLPFSKLYYQNDPTDPLFEFAPEKIDKIHGMESVLRIRNSVPLLAQGYVDLELQVRLRHTADVLLGRRSEGPDLVHHLHAVGPAVCKGMPPEEFGVWLSDRVDALERNSIDEDLIEWLEQLLPTLREVERDILSWLRGVRDFRYALAQYMSGVSFFDHAVGQIVEALKEQGIYEDTTVVVTSPHGELLDEEDLHFHHHAVFEPVLRIPLIIKPAKKTLVRRGTRVAGVMDEIDIAPTLLELMGIPEHIGSGVSRRDNVITGQAIAEHDSFAIDLHGATAAIKRKDFVLLKALHPYFVSPKWQWFPGDKRLYRITTPMAYTENLAQKLPLLTQEMESALDQFLAESRVPTDTTNGLKLVSRSK